MNFDLFDGFAMLGYMFFTVIITIIFIVLVVLVTKRIWHNKKPSLSRVLVMISVTFALFVAALGAHHAIWVSELSSMYVWEHPMVGSPNDKEARQFWQDFEPFREGTRTVRADFESDLIIEYNWPRLDGSTALLPVYSAVAETIYSGLHYTNNFIRLSTTSGAFERLIGIHEWLGDVDIIFALQPSQEHVDIAHERGIELIRTPIAREAFVFFVNENNPVDGLTVEQIQQIYTGEISNWRDVGGRNEKIATYQRNPGSGSQIAMKEIVMAGLTMMQPESNLEAMGMGVILRSVAQYTNHERALGYSFRFYATEMNPHPGLRLLAINGVEPTTENITDGSYPLTGNVYAITTARGLENPNTQKVLDWLVSPQGQRLIELAGYVGLE